jgi:uncharacterized protein YndB with AHSA1/START domain
MDTSTANPAQNEFVITRVLNAPRELVFQVWTQAEHLTQWWGPKNFVVRQANLDLRSGGSLHYCLEGPDGKEMWGKWTFKEVTPPERLVFLSGFSNPQGNITRAPFSEVWPLEVLSTLTFAEQDGKTLLTMRGVAWNATEAECNTFEAGIASMNAGWGGTFEVLETYLDGLQ